MKKMLLAGALGCASLMSAFAHAEYPERPVEIIVPWPPGDLEDVVARMISDQIQKDYGVPSAVVNMKGGGGVIGASHVASARPDGYTVGMFTGNILTTHIIKKRAPFNAETFEPVGIAISYPMAIWAKGDLPFNDLAGLAEYAKENPVRLAHYGFNGPPTRQTLMMANKLGFEFSGNAAYDEPNCTLLASGDADVVISSVKLMRSCLDSGEAKPLAAYTAARIKILPDLPTLDEQVPGIAAPSWAGLFVRSEVPEEIREKIAASAQKVLQSQVASDIEVSTGAVLDWTADDAATSFVSEQYKRIEALLAQ
ncbi:tripartite tricarboxylate transporter substrate binding protein [Marinobacterium sp. YM272]|uniref:tripartite tricarboxylate transporter substrate binding protein n=1 Tax=Marinobacterium sp. YM272 TaxID=3421654 RepID=UPI003D7F86EB